MDFEQFLELQDQNAENIAEVIQNYIKKTTKASRGLRFPDDYNFNTSQSQTKFLSMFLEQFTGRFQDLNQQINTADWQAYERQGLKKILKLSFQYHTRDTREQDQLLNDREFINKFQNRNAANLLIVTKPILYLADVGNEDPMFTPGEVKLTWTEMKNSINQSQLPENQQRKTRAQKNLYENEFILLQNEMCQTIANTIYKNKFFRQGFLQRQMYQFYQQGQVEILDVWHNYLIMNDLQTIPQRFPEYHGQDDDNYRTLPNNFGVEGSAVNTSGELYQQLFYNPHILTNQQRYFFENINIMQTMLLGLMEQTQFAKQAHFFFHGGNFNYNFARDTSYEQKLTFLINNTDPVNTSLLQHFNFPGENDQKVISFPSILWQQNISPMFFTTVYMFIQWLMSLVMIEEDFDFNEVTVLSFYAHIFRTKFVHGANISNQQQYEYKYGSFQGFQFVTTLKICNHIWWLMNRDNTYTKMGFTLFIENNIEQLTHRTDAENDQLDQPFDGDLMKLQFERAQFQLKVLDSHFGLRFSNISIYNLDATISQMIVDSYNDRTMYRERVGVSIEFTERLKRKIKEKIDWMKKRDNFNLLNAGDRQQYRQNVQYIRKNIETVIRNQYTQKIIEEGDRDKLQSALQRILISSVKEFIGQRNLLDNQLFTGGRVSIGVFYNILFKVQMREGGSHEVQNWLTARGYLYKIRPDQEGFDQESFNQNFDLLQVINNRTHKESKLGHNYEFFPERVFFNPKGYLNQDGMSVEYRESFEGQEQNFHKFVKKQALLKIKQSFLQNQEQQQDFCDQLFIQIILQIFESAFYQESGYQDLRENTDFFENFSLQNIKLQRIQLIYFPVAGVDGTSKKESERLLDSFQKVQLQNLQKQQEQQEKQQQLEKEIEQIFDSDKEKEQEEEEEEKMVNVQDEIRLLEQQLQEKQQKEQQIYREVDDDELEKEFNQPLPQEQDELEKDFYKPIKQRKKRQIKQKTSPQKRQMPTILTKADIQLQKKKVIPEKVMDKVEVWRRRFWSHIDLDGLPELAQKIEDWYKIRGGDQSLDILSNLEYEQMLEQLIIKYTRITNETVGNYAVDITVQQLFDRIYRNPLWSEIRKNPFMGILSQIYRQKIQLWSEIKFFSQLDCKFQLYNCLCKVWFYIFYISHSIRFYFFQNTWNENFKNLFPDFQNAKEVFKDLRNFQLFNRVIMMTTIQQNHKNKIFQQFCESLSLGQLTKSFQFFFDFIISQKINPEEFKKPQNTINIIQIIDFSHINKPEFILKQQLDIRLKELQNLGFNVSTRTETMIRIGVYDFHIFIANAKQFAKLLTKITIQDNKSQQQQLLQQQLQKNDQEKQIKQQQYRYPLFLNNNRKLQQKINFNKLQQIDVQNLQQECLSKFELFKYNNIIKKFSEENDFKLLQQYSSVIAFDFETTSQVSTQQNINLMNPYAFALYGNIHLFGFDKNQPPHKQLVEIYPNTSVSQIIDIDMDLLNDQQIEILFQQRFIQRKFVKYIFKLNEEIDQKINEYNEKYLIIKEKKEKYNSGDNRQKKQSVQLVNNVKFVGFNSAKFDLHLVINEIIRLYQGFNIQNNLRFVGDKNSIKRIQIGHVIFEDCYPLMQGSLKMWSISFNPDDKQYQKDQSVQIKNLQTIQQIRQNYKEIKQYNLQDAKSTYSVYLNFIKLVNNLVKRLYDQQKVPQNSRIYYSPDNLPLTIASLAIQTINKVYQYSAINQNIFAKGISESNLKMDPEIYTACRKSYYGGIVLPFSIKRYNTDFYGLDVNSLYPFIMKQNCRNFPVSFSYSKIQRLDIKRNDYMYKNILQFLKPHYLYKVEGFQFQKGKLVTLPTRIEKELIYVEKCFEVESYRWGCEIIFAIQKDLLERIIITKTFIFEQKPLDFIGQYVETLYNERVKSKKEFAIQQLERKVKIIEKERNKKKLTEQQIQQKVDRKLEQIKNVYEMILKLYLNSSYGKLAQKEFDQFQFIDHKQLEELLFKTGLQSSQQLEDQLDQYIKEITPFEDDDYQNQNQFVGFQDPVSTIFRVRMSNNKLNLNNNIGTLAFIASQITALARIHLQGLIITAGGPESKDIYYSDTDSIYCSSRAYLKLLKAGQVDPNQLGKLKVELDSSKYQFKQFQAFGQKVYDIQLQKDNNQRLENKCAFKGVMGKMRDIIISQFRFQGYYDPNLQKEFDEDFKSVQIKWKKLQSQGIIRMEQMLGIINLKPKLQYNEDGEYVKFVSDLNEYYQVYKNLIIKLLQNDKFEYVLNLPQQQ